MRYTKDEAKSSYQETIQLPLSKKKMPLVLRTSLAATGWTNIAGSDHLGKLTAQKRSTDERSGITFKDEFCVHVSWDSQGELSTVTLTIVDRQNFQNRFGCISRCRALVDELLENAAKFLKLGNPELDPDLDDVDRFATQEDFEDAEMIDDPSDANRFSLGLHESQMISLPAVQAQMHTLVCGPTRSGKTSGIFIPNLLDRLNMSAIVTEATAGNEAPDLYFRTAGWRHRHGHKIYYFNPDDLTSDRFNPLDQIELGNHAKFTGRQVNSVANLLMRTTQQSAHRGDQFWTDCERFLLRSLLWHAVGEREKGNGHLGYVCDLLTLPQSELEATMLASRMIKARKDFRSFMTKGSEDTRNIVMQGLLQRLDLWTEPMTVELTRTTDINLEELPNQLFTFYIAMPGHKEELQPLAALLVNWIVDIALGTEFKHPITLLLDEFTNFGFVSSIDRKLTTIGHRKIPMVIGIQDIVQLQIVYKEYAPIFTTQPGTQVFLKPRDPAIAEKLSEQLGKTTAIDWDSRGHDVVPRKVSRKLLTGQKLMSLRGEAIVFLPNCCPAKLKLMHWSAYTDKTDLRPPKRRMLEMPDINLFAVDTDSDDLQSEINRLKRQVEILTTSLVSTKNEAEALLQAGQLELAEQCFAKAREQAALINEAKIRLAKASLASPPAKPKRSWSQKRRPNSKGNDGIPF